MEWENFVLSAHIPNLRQRQTETEIEWSNKKKKKNRVNYKYHYKGFGQIPHLHLTELTDQVK